jgi:hypothetical protein
MGKRVGTLTGWSADFTLTEEMERYAKEKGLNPVETFESFKDYHEMHGSKFASWPAAWRTWCRNAVVFAAARADKSLPTFRSNNSRTIGFTVPRAQPAVVEQARRENELARQEVLSLTPIQRHLNIQKLKAIIGEIK